MAFTEAVSQMLRAELERAAESAGPVADQASLALSDAPINARLEAAIRALVAHRGPQSSTCPSDAARSVGGDRWRDLMDAARDAARTLAVAGVVQITQGGKVLDPGEPWHGPIRIRTAD